MSDVAQAAKVHPSTVSLALRNDHRLPLETREHVRRIAEELGYRPHPLLSALGAARRARRDSDYGCTLAYVERADQPTDWEDETLIGARHAAEERGYNMEHFTIREKGLSEERLTDILRNRGIRGILIAPLMEAHGHFELDWQEFCTVVIGYSFTTPEFDRVVQDPYQSMRLILGKCRELGLTRIGLLLPEAGYERNEGLHAAAFWIEQKTGLASIPPLILSEWNPERFLQWMDPHGLEVIVTSNVFKSKVMEILDVKKIQIPRDISFVNVNAYRSEEFSGIYTNSAQVGATAVHILIDKINRNASGIPALRNTILVPGQWVEGQTLKGVSPAGCHAGTRNRRRED